MADRSTLNRRALIVCLALSVQPAPASAQRAAPAAAPITCTQPRAVDGDTLRCTSLSAPVRLLGIDAPELPGHCRRGRTCAPGDPVASRAALASLIASGTVTVEIVGRDRYARHLGVVRVRSALANPVTGARATVNLSCAMIAAGQAIYVSAWDNGHRIVRECGQ